MRAHSVQSAPRTITFADAATFKDVDAIVTSIATDTSEQTFSGAGLDGTVGAAQVPTHPYGRRLSVTTSSNAGTYTATGITAVVNKIVKNSGGALTTEQVTVNATLTAVNGGETVYFDDVPVASVVSITAPAQNDTSGAYEFGLADIYAPPLPGRAISRQLESLGAGTIKVRYDGAFDDTLTVVAQGKIECAPNKIYGDANTDVGFIIYV